MMPGIHTVHVSVRHAVPLVACGLHAALAARTGMVVVPDAADVVVADLPEALRLLCERDRPPAARRADGPRVLVVASADPEHVVRQAFAWGIRGYLTVGCAIDELDRAIRVVATGARYVCATAARDMAQSLAREPLTPRENDVLRVLMRGACNKDIARELRIALGTVKAHVKAIMDKLDARCRTEVVSIATERGLVDDRVPMPMRGAPSRSMLVVAA